MDRLPTIKGLTKHQPVQIDNFVFRLHTQVTSLIFFSAAAILVTNQFFGDPIRCFTHGSEHVEDHYSTTIATLCWISSTFTVKEHLCGRIDKEVPYSGIGTLTPERTPFHIHVTYRFLFFILFLQGLSFLLPRYMWRSWEADKMKMLSVNLKNPLLDEKSKMSTLYSLKTYIMQGNHNGSTKYSVQYHLCEAMSLIIFFINLLVTNYIFRYKFISYGLKAVGEMLSGSDEDELCDDEDPMKFLFPQVAKCIQKLVGPSGNVMAIDHLCVLPLNDFNSNFFKFVWIWFAILLIASVFWIAVRAATIYSRRFRTFLLERRGGLFATPLSHEHDVVSCCSEICSRLTYADWRIIWTLGSNMDPLTYRQFLESFCQQTGAKETEKALKHTDEYTILLTDTSF